MILISSCLAGQKVRYNGTDCLNEDIQRLMDENKVTIACPELLGGFSIPREPAEIVGGNGEDVLDGRAKVISRSGTDVTEMYIKGAFETLKIAHEVAATIVVLKENSPSCGSSMIYNGEFQGVKVTGHGVTTALLRKNGIVVVSEEELSDLILESLHNSK